MITKVQDKYDLQRFIQAQDPVYHRVVTELSLGTKNSHWMWFIFPQIIGLGHSARARHYAIKSKDEASAYLLNSVLGARLNECCQLLLKNKSKSASEILGHPDNIKLRSSMTLFSAISESGSVFQQVLDQFYNCQNDPLTITRLNEN